jgi:hypothetical protein
VVGVVRAKWLVDNQDLAAVFKVNTSFLRDLVMIVSLFVIVGICCNLASPKRAEAGPPKEKQPPQVSQKDPSKAGSPGKKLSTKKESSSPVMKSLTKHPGPGTQDPKLRTQDSGSGTRHKLTPNPKRTASIASRKAKYHGTFVETLKSAPFPYSGKGVDPNFFDSVDPRTGERYRTTRTLERLSEKEHYWDSSVLFHLPSQFNPRKPFAYVVFFHGNRTEVRQFTKDYRLDEQMERSGRNAILVLPQLAKNAADSTPGKFSNKDAFRAFMLEVAHVLTSRLGKQYQKQLEQAPIIFVAFSGGYKPLACTLDRGGTGSRTKGVLLLDALYDDLYIFGKWILENARRGFFVNIFTEDSSCEEKSRTLAQFLRAHHLPFKEEWPEGLRKGHICLMRSPNDHLQIPIAGPPREPLAELLRNLKN